MTSNISRRGFLQRSGALGAAGMGMPLVMNLLPTQAHAALDTSGYRAIVCVYLNGGNDAYNTVIRTDRGLSRFKNARPTVSQDVLNADLTAKMPVIIPQGANFTDTPDLGLAFHPSLPQLKQRFEMSQLAVIGNIGPLAASNTTAQAYRARSVALPPKLLSHNDQTAIWQSGQLEGQGTGWGGEIVRLFSAGNRIDQQQNNLFSAVAVEASPVFCSGADAQMPGGLPPVAPFGASRNGEAVRPGGETYYDPDGPAPGYYPFCFRLPRETVLDSLFGDTFGQVEGQPFTPTQHLIERDYLASLRSADEAWKVVDEAYKFDDLPNPSSSNPLLQQLFAVAKMIRMHALGKMQYSRQVFFVQLGTFDTHSGQTSNNGGSSEHGRLLGLLDEALAYFSVALGPALMQDVLTFTASEFGRKLNENGDGTDHGWGGHHFVMGGNIRGGVYGNFPDLSTWQQTESGQYGDSQLLFDGTMVPKVSVAAFAKELGQWMGVTWSDPVYKDVAARLFPHLGADEALVGFVPQAS